MVTFINGLAGGASSLSLPIMILLGLPPTVANGTNRFGMIVGIFSSVFNMRRYGYLRMDIAKALLLPTILGGAAGTLIAVVIDDAHFQVLLAIVMVGVAIMSSLGTDPFGKPPEKPPERPSAKAFLGFAAVGFYGGFLQVGMGFLQIFSLRKYSGLDLKQVNALKSFLSFWFILISSLGFFVAGKVVLELAISMALGGVFGGLLSSKFQHKHDMIWIKRAIQFASIGLAGKLIYDLLPIT
ncbi:hypothetical protein R83H12_01774 [Fibrobacteria bacterium R8-3-H12]